MTAMLLLLMMVMMKMMMTMMMMMMMNDDDNDDDCSERCLQGGRATNEQRARTLRFSPYSEAQQAGVHLL